ncbi:hypothetical protein [Photobacterium kishitanii]|uniref:hypothetical protein n=1 Tax=Photobacterium kishitanii TaxID=318456 RepID=UPI002739EBC0|nr:hypothetical protein [Photobacterium kishitanii]
MKEHYSFIHWMANTIRRFTKWLYTLRHIFVALFVLGNSGLIFHTIYGLPIDLFTLFNVRDYEQINTSFLTNAPYFMLGVFIVMSSVGLFLEPEFHG